MNLNEVKKHVKFDMFLTTLIYIMIAVCLFLALIFTLAIPAKAATTSTNLTSSGIQAGQHCSSHPNNTFCSAMIYQNGSGNPCGAGDSRCYLYVNSNYSDLVMSLNFKINTSVHAYTNATVTLRGTGFDNVSYSCSATGGVSNCRINRVSSTALNINFSNNTSSNISYPEFDVYTNSGFNSNKTFKVTSVTLYETPQQDSGSSGGGSSGTTFDDTGIINNANQNTEEIINNANQNATDTQNVIINTAGSIINELANRCGNLISPNLFANGNYAESTGVFVPKSNTTINNTNADNGSISFTTTSEWWGVANTDYIAIAPQGTYYLKLDINTSTFYVDVFYYNSNKEYISYYQSWVRNSSTSSHIFSFTAPVNASYILIGFSSNLYGNFTISNLTLNANNGSFCAYGSTISKLDLIGIGLEALGYTEEQIKEIQENIKDTQQDQYDYLTDDTDPVVPNNEINDVLGSVNVQDPLNYLLTLPLNLLNKLNSVISSGTCSKASFGELYGTELYLPCINFENYLGSSLWGTIDTIVGIGLLAIILKKFYDTISNILSLGKEEEIRKGMELPTPMEFFAQILGGGK